MPRILTWATWSVVAAFASAAAADVEVVMKTEGWGNNDAAFAKFHERIARMRGRNLLARPEIKAADTGRLRYGKLRMLSDGSAGVRLGAGRVGINGQPAVLTFYLGEPKAVFEIGLFTYNSDARANQDFEVRFANNSAHPGVKPTFPDKPHLTTGPKIVGNNRGGFHTYFRTKDGGALVTDKADWVQFRIWRTYNQKAGAPGKAQSKATSWTSVIEIEVFGDKNDIIEIPEDDIDRQQISMRKAIAKLYKKKATWQDTMLAIREALMTLDATHSGPADFKPYVSPLLRGRDKPVHVKVNVAGLKRLWLEADIGGDSHSADQAVWGEPTLIDKDGGRTPLTALKPAYVKVGWGELGVDRDHWKKPLQIAKRQFKRGLWAHAPSQLCFALDGKYEWFEAWVGIGARAGKGGSSRFKVLALPSAEASVDDLWRRLARDFRDDGARREMAWEKEDTIWNRAWPVGDVTPLAQRYAKAAHRSEALAREAKTLAKAVTNAEDLGRVRDVYHRSRRLHEALAKAGTVPWRAMRMAVEDLTETYGERYPRGTAHLARVARLEKAMSQTTERASKGWLADIAQLETLATEAVKLQREALLANPLFDFGRLLLVKRKANRLGLPANWQGNCSLPKTGYDNEIAVLSMAKPDDPLRTLYKPDGGRFVGDVDLHFDADRMLFSSIGSNGRWHLFEIKSDGAGLRQVTRNDQPDVDYYDPCYLPDGDIIFSSTASFTGVPCVYGGSHVAMLYRMKPRGTGIRQLCFEQDHDWCPTMLPNGRVLYSRWEYTDTPHSNTRLLFHMNPDGTGQMEYYGSNSYWPNSIFYARPIPGHASKVVGIVTGHHGDRRMGEMVIFDPELGRREADGAVQRIPGHGKKVEAICKDRLTVGVWPKFLHPYPLSEKHFLVSCKPTAKSNWGVYLVDVFDNMVLLREEPGYALLEPIPLRKTLRPPVIPDRVPKGRTDAVVYMANVYEGDGLKGIPKGTAKRLRLFSYHFAYQGMGGLLGVVGVDGPWDVKRVLGTVPIEEDGSAMFRVPANTPISVQPLDAEGKALQIMRSWMTAMPGETLSCVGCHEPQNSAVTPPRTIAATKPATEIEAWYGRVRGFSYPREVQPVIDKYCIGCHDGNRAMDLRGTEQIKDFRQVCPGRGGSRGGKFSVGYANLHRFVRRPGIESDYHLLTPMEFHADTTELMQMLKAGHSNVRPDAEAWDRLITWIDLNTPYHGTWQEATKDPGEQRQRRRELRKLYAGIDEDPEADAELTPAVLEARAPALPIRPVPTISGNPQPLSFDTAEAKRRRAAACIKSTRAIDLGNGVTMDLVLVPAGEFVMGDADAPPLRRVRIDRPFWIGRCEVSNEQFAQFDPTHDSRVESKNHYQFGIHGYPVNEPKQPVVRVSCEQAQTFCQWLSARAGEAFRLPAEEQWEYACRAGTATPFSYGDMNADFSKSANMADAKLSEFASNPYTVDKPLSNPTKYDDYIPKDTRFNDGGLVTMAVGSYQPNAWGLHDMHGNACEWTRTAANGRMVVRGGSWRDRPKRCTSASRSSYPRYQRVFNVGFRVMCGAKSTEIAARD